MKAGEIDRKALGLLVLNDQKEMGRLEALIHPLVTSKRSEFLRRTQMRGERLVVLDIPLLFEGKGLDEVDATIVVTANSEEQRRRVLARPGMNEDKFAALLQRQITDQEKRRRAHFIVQTRKSMASTERQIRRIIAIANYVSHRNLKYK